jgi:hypothetical protein
VSIDNSRLFLSVIQKNMQLVDTKEQLEHRIRDLKLLFELESAMGRAHVARRALHGRPRRSDALVRGARRPSPCATDHRAALPPPRRREATALERAPVASRVRRLPMKEGQGLIGAR